jgi:hypothetical protein
MNARVIGLLMLCWTAGELTAQEDVSLGGYLSDMQTMYHLSDRWLWENTLHNRLNFHVYPTPWMSASLQVRNRLIMGNTIKNFPGYADAMEGDMGWADLHLMAERSLGDSAGYILSFMVDRLWLQWTLGNLEVKIGRQRINWGQTFVWNPNDIFNSYSYFEVDYPERPGSDAARIQYYTGNASTIELAAKMDSARRVTAAGYFRFNIKGFDIQLLGGIYQQDDLVLGTGWSGNVGQAAFRGEVSWFRDLDHFRDTAGYALVSAGLDYTFANSLWIQVEGLYSGFAKESDMSSLLTLYSGNLDVKGLGFTKWSFFANLSYPFTPLISGGFAAIYFPDWKGYYLGPSFDLSMNRDLDLSLIFQYFSAKIEIAPSDPSRENSLFGFLRFKWSF